MKKTESIITHFFSKPLFLKMKDLLKTIPHGPLNGLMVVEIGQHVSGPMVGERLARKGALVIKIEDSGTGDPARGYLSEEIFNSLNANKLSFALGPKDDVYPTLLAMADVIIDNRSPHAKANDFRCRDFLKSKDKTHPVIFCSLVGYEGDDNNHLLALDVSVQAATGMAYVNGSQPGQPLKVGFVVLDEVTAIEASDAIMTHLFALARGAKCPLEAKNVISLEISMTRVSAYLLTGQILNYLTQGKEPPRTANRDNWLSPFSYYPTKDGVISVAIVNEDQYKRLCLNVLKSAELFERFPTNQIRMQNISEFEATLIKILIEKESAHWLAECQSHKVPASRVNTVGEALKQSFFKNIISRTSDGTAIISDPATSSLYDKNSLQRAPFYNEHGHLVMVLADVYDQLKLSHSFTNFFQLYNQLSTDVETLLDSQEIFSRRLAKL